MYNALVITGTSGSGKSTVAKELVGEEPGLGLVKAVTTRARRNDDDSDQYEYVGRDEFARIEEGDELMIATSYRGERYGIRQRAVDGVRSEGKVPLLVITPESANEMAKVDPLGSVGDRPLIVYIDGTDGRLDRRLSEREVGGGVDAQEQRAVDRGFSDAGVYNVRKGSVEDVRELVLRLWRSRDLVGVVPGMLIERLIACGTLLEGGELCNISGASYDLSLGDEYFYGGKIHWLSEREPILTVEPYDYAIVTSREVADLPRDVSGRFDLRVSLFCQGVILSNGPQVDPGFRGPLFCLLFNTSNHPVLLKRGEHYATIEFHKLWVPTRRYSGPYQAKTLVDYLPSNAARGAINELKKELEEVRKEAKNLQGATWGILSLILAVIAIFVSFQ